MKNTTSIIKKENPAAYGDGSRELRKRLRFSQARLALELDVSRIAIARQETGVYEPRTSQVKALMQLCERHGFKDILELLRRHLSAKEQERQRQAEAAAALEYLESVELRAKSGDQQAASLLRLSGISTTVFAQSHLDLMNDAREKSEGLGFAEAAHRIADQMYHVAQLQRAQQRRAERDYEELLQKVSRLTKLKEYKGATTRLQNRELRKAIADAEAELAEGKVPDLLAFFEKAVSILHENGEWSEAQKNRVSVAFISLLRLEIINGIYEAARVSAQEGNPLDAVIITRMVRQVLDAEAPALGRHTAGRRIPRPTPRG